jgi:hypothetical protein
LSPVFCIEQICRKGLECDVIEFPERSNFVRDDCPPEFEVHLASASERDDLVTGVVKEAIRQCVFHYAPLFLFWRAPRRHLLSAFSLCWFTLRLDTLDEPVDFPVFDAGGLQVNFHEGSLPLVRNILYHLHC